MIKRFKTFNENKTNLDGYSKAIADWYSNTQEGVVALRFWQLLRYGDIIPLEEGPGNINTYRFDDTEIKYDLNDLILYYKEEDWDKINKIMGGWSMILFLRKKLKKQNIFDFK